MWLGECFTGVASLADEVWGCGAGERQKMAGHFSGQFRSAVLQYDILLKKVDEFARKGSSNG